MGRQAPRHPHHTGAREDHTGSVGPHCGEVGAGLPVAALQGVAGGGEGDVSPPTDKQTTCQHLGHRSSPGASQGVGGSLAGEMSTIHMLTIILTN